MAIITISRGTGSGGQAMAECLAEELRYPLLGQEVMAEAASGLGVTEEELDQQIAAAPKLWDRHSATRRACMAAMQAVLAEHALEGNLIYYGLAGQVLLKDLPGVLRVRLIAPIEMRIQALVDHQHMDRESAEQYILHVDAQRANWVRTVCGVQIEDPILYDLVINIETMSVLIACAFVAATVKQTDFDMTEAIMERLADFRLASLVKVALARAPQTRSLELEVEARKGVVEISGRAPLLSDGATGDNLTEIASSVPGVTEARLAVEWYDPYP